MARKKRKGTTKATTQQKIFWVLSLLVAISLVFSFGLVNPRRRATPPTPTPIITVTPEATPQLTPTSGG